jgi:cysteine-rich repeat protein
MSVRVRLSAVLFVFALGLGHAGCSDDDASGPVCGNGVVEAGEECDDGNHINGDGCTGYCLVEITAWCGNGALDTGEQCDDGNTTSGDGCSATCQDETTPVCGNSTVETGEDCDDGNTTGGDGCSATCQDEPTPVCGNSAVEAGEECDDGNTNGGDGCSATCQEEICGNGVLDSGEQCDDGNGDNTDNCPDGIDGSCLSATCGDGFAYTGIEGCDDGNTTSGDGCSATCDIESCGNGTVETGEDCDDGNADNTDACPDGTGGSCLDANCGDGFVWDGHEECDDGNNTDDDGCNATCVQEICGDGVLHTGEECDDGNQTDGDGCESDCTATTCGDPIDCGNVNSFVCDVDSETCSASQCTYDANSCGTGCTGTDPCCFEQTTGSGVGACFEICDPYDTPCPTGLECSNLNVNQGAGLCQNPGTVAVGAPCTPTTISTGCAPGGICLNDSGNNLCFEECDFFGTPACGDAGSSCWPFGYCDAAPTVNAATIGQECIGATVGDPCHPNGDGFLGSCQDNAGTLECYQLCQLWSRSGNVRACTTGSCNDVFSGDWEGDIGLCNY